MDRLRKTIARSLAGACILVGAGAGMVSAAAGGSAQLEDQICQKALDPPARAISVTALMRPIAGTQHMELEFQLLMKTPTASAFIPVTGTGLGTWLTPPNPTLGQRSGDIWVLHHPVADLPAPAVYHFSVSFRWIGAGGRVLGTVTRTGHNCNQPELRPDLYVQSFVAQPAAGHPNIDHYTAVFGNQGGGAAKNFQVVFSDAGNQVTRVIADLPKGTTRTEVFVGPPCVAAAPATFALDPKGAVDDANRANNSATASCPATGPTGATGHTGASGATGTQRSGAF